MFLRQLKQTNPPNADGRRWIYVPYDQLNDQIGPLGQTSPEDAAIILIETRWKPARRPYHRQKLGWVLASQRHFALEQARRGVHVHYLFGEDSYGDMLREFVEERGVPVMMAKAAELELRDDLQPLVDDDLLTVEPHTGWFTEGRDFDALGDPPWRMDAFYRQVRQRTGVLMDDGSPVGGRYSFDGDNRERWDGQPPAPAPPTFEVDEIKQEVADLIEQRFSGHPGELDMSRIAATSEEAKTHWDWVVSECMTEFGPYEDAMSTKSSTLFHTLVSPLLNNGRLLARDVVADIESADIPLNSKEGFIRQVIGWREFVRHVHERTDGFRTIEANHLAATEPLPQAFWTGDSGLHCLDTVVGDVWRTGYGHHITRLMIVSNIATLLGIDPQELSDWFWVGYVDAYDWVVEPNVIGMGTFGVGELMTTKPYVSGSNYIAKMSNYCDDCAFDPKKTCPLKRAYWAFLARNADRLEGNRRMGRALWSVGRRSDEQKELDSKTVTALLDSLRNGEPFTPDSAP